MRKAILCLTALFAFVEPGLCDVYVPGEYATIQGAVDAVSPGESIILSDGVYSGVGNYDVAIEGKNIAAIKSLHGAETCWIDCQNLGRAFTVANASVTFIGLSVHGGESGYGGVSITSDPGVNAVVAFEECVFSGGAIYVHNTELFVDSCDITHNDYGGGVNISCDPNAIKPTLIENCLISHNYSFGGGDTGMGGGVKVVNSEVYLYGTEISYCDCGGYDGGAGGGVYGKDSVVCLWACYLHHNGDEDDCYRDLHGGGLFLNNCTLEVHATIFYQNIACNGAAIAQDGGSGSIGDSQFVHNRAVYSGGAIDLYGCGTTVPFRLFNCSFEDNASSPGPVTYSAYGAAICAADSILQIEQCTLVRNTSYAEGGGIRIATDYGESRCTIANSIFWGNTPEAIDLAPGVSPEAVKVSYSDLEGGFVGEGNLDDDPQFSEGAEGSLYLSQIVAGQTLNSPCVDAGSTIPENLSLTYHYLPNDLAIAMSRLTTRTDTRCDRDCVDMGFHYTDSTPNPMPGKTLELLLDDTILNPGDRCFLHYYLYNPEANAYDADIYLVLQVAGDYWFFPSWREETDYVAATVGGASYLHTLVFNFVWPARTGSGHDLDLWGAACEPNSSAIIGELQHIRFDYGDS